MKYGQIWMKKYAKRSEAKKNTEQLKEGLKSSILGPQNLGSGGPGPLGPPLDPLVVQHGILHGIFSRISQRRIVNIQRNVPIKTAKQFV